MTQVTQEVSIIPSSEADREDIFKAIVEASECLIRIDGEKEQIKSIIEAVTEKYEIKKNLLSKMIQTYHKNNLSKIEQDNAEFIEAYDAIISENL